MDDLPTLHFHHSDLLVRGSKPKYEGGSVYEFKNYDMDKISMIELGYLVSEIGCKSYQYLCYTDPSEDLTKGITEIKELGTDSDVLGLIASVKEYKVLEIYIQHDVEEVVFENADELNGTQDSDSFANADSEDDLHDAPLTAAGDGTGSTYPATSVAGSEVLLLCAGVAGDSAPTPPIGGVHALGVNAIVVSDWDAMNSDSEDLRSGGDSSDDDSSGYPVFRCHWIRKILNSPSDCDFHPLMI